MADIREFPVAPEEDENLLCSHKANISLQRYLQIPRRMLFISLERQSLVFNDFNKDQLHYVDF